MASSAKVSTKAIKGQAGFIKRLNIAVILLGPSPIVQAITPPFVPKNKKNRRSQIV